MATKHAQNDSPQQPQPTEFEIRRAGLVGEIGDSLEQVLAQINALNRSLEGIIEIGNEFASVEALWSQFEGVMGRSEEDGTANSEGDENANGEDDETQIPAGESGKS